LYSNYSIHVLSSFIHNMPKILDTALYDIFQPPSQRLTSRTVMLYTYWRIPTNVLAFVFTTVHSTTFLIGHFFCCFTTSTQPISSKFLAFYTDIWSYRNPLKLANLFSRRVVPLYHYWFLHFRCDVIIWNTQIIKIWFVVFYNVYCCIKTFYIM